MKEGIRTQLASSASADNTNLAQYYRERNENSPY